MKKIFVFPLLYAVLITILSCKESARKKTNFPNYLKNTEWIVNEGGLITPDSAKSYNLSPRDTTLIFNFHGVSFSDAENFRSFDSWQCGNDCFTGVYGKYYFTEKNQIQMEVDSIRKSEFCDTPTQIFKPSKKMSFNLVKKGSQLRLMRK